MKTLYQLSDAEFDNYLKSIESRKIRSAISQRRTELLAINYGYTLSHCYQYESQNKNITLICRNGHSVIKIPNLLYKNFRCLKCEKVDKTIQVSAMIKAKKEKRNQNENCYNEPMTINDLISKRGSLILKAALDEK